MKLSLRDLFWLVLVVGMGCGWIASELRWRDHDSQHVQRYRHADMVVHQMHAALEQNGHTLTWVGDEGVLVDGNLVDGLK